MGPPEPREGEAPGGAVSPAVPGEATLTRPDALPDCGSYLQEASGHAPVILAQHQIVHEHPEEGLPAARAGPGVLQDAVELEQVPRWGVWGVGVPGEGCGGRGG